MKNVLLNHPHKDADGNMVTPKRVAVVGRHKMVVYKYVDGIFDAMEVSAWHRDCKPVIPGTQEGA